MDKSEFVKLLKNYKYEEAYLMIKSLSTHEKWDFLCSSFMHDDTAPEIGYSFISYLIAVDEDEAEWHYLCCQHFIYFEPFFDDGYRLAAWHLKQAIRLNPENLEYKEEVTSFFSGYSVKYFSKKETYEYAIDVLKKYPNNFWAKEILSEGYGDSQQ